MFRKLLLLSITSVTLFLFSSCVEEPSSIGSSLLTPDLVNLDSLDSYKDTLGISSSVGLFKLPLGTSDMLLLGKNSRNEANMLLNFLIGMSDTLKTMILNGQVTITQAYVEMFVSYKLGNPISGFTFTAHKINSGWTSAGFIADSLAALNFDAGNSASDIRFTQSDSMMTFNLDTALVGYWLRSEADSNLLSDNGILLKPVSTNGILGFNAVSFSDGNVLPLLQIVISNPAWSEVDTLRFLPAADLSTVSGTVPASTENIYVQSGVIINSFLKFDLSKVPEHAVINYAELQITVDTTESVTGVEFTNSIAAYRVTDSTAKDTSVTNRIVLTRSGSVFKGNIASDIQYWLSTKDNQGLLLRTNDPLKGLELFALKGTNTADPLLRPRLKIIFTNKK